MATAFDRHAGKVEEMRQDFLRSQHARIECELFGTDPTVAAARYGTSERVLRDELGEPWEPQIPPHLIGPDGKVRLGKPYSIEEHE